MTPQRKKYLEKCGDKEKILRGLIEYEKNAIKKIKNLLNDECFDPEEKRYYYNKLKLKLISLQSLRQNLSYLKKTNNIAIPSVTYIGNENDIFLQKVLRCVCSERLYGYENYCPECGRRLLWGKTEM